MGFFSNLKDKMFGSDYYYDSEEDMGMMDDGMQQYSEQMGTKNTYPPHLQPVNKNMYSNVKGAEVSNYKSEIINLELTEYAKTGEACAFIKAQKPIVLNVRSLNEAESQRAIDYLTGAVHALNGTINKVAEGIFIFAPNHVEVNADIKKSVKNNY